MLALRIQQSRYPIEVERMTNAAVSSIHREGGVVIKISILGDGKDGFVSSIIYDDGVATVMINTQQSGVYAD